MGGVRSEFGKGEEKKKGRRRTGRGGSETGSGRLEGENNMTTSITSAVKAG